jgi:hypothetical protein
LSNAADTSGNFLSGFRLAPEKLFLIAAIIGGLLLVFLIPPVAGGNEQMNFRRVASIANGHLLVEPASVPGGYAEFLQVTEIKFGEGAKPPYSYSLDDLGQAAAVELQPGRPEVIRPNPISVLNPLSYLPQAPSVWLAQALGLSPLIIFYIARLAGLAGAIALTFFAVRIIPFHKHTLAAVALLPPVLFARSTVDGDVFTIAVAFLFMAMLFREIGGRGRISATAIAGLAVAGFLLAQAKSAYLLLPLFSLAIPAERFGGWRGKAMACAAIALPGIVASVGWLLLVKQGFLAGMQYRTWSGIADPDGQFALILSNPLGYAAVLLRTLFATTFVPKAITDMMGVFGPPVMAPVVVLAATALLLGATAASDQGPVQSALRDWRTRALALALAAATLLIIMTTVYMQWTRVGAPVVEGFNGRYLYPLAPLVLLAIPTAGKPVFGLRAPAWLLVLAVASVTATCVIAWQTYLA